MPARVCATRSDVLVLGEHMLPALHADTRPDSTVLLCITL